MPHQSAGQFISALCWALLATLFACAGSSAASDDIASYMTAKTAVKEADKSDKDKLKEKEKSKEKDKIKIQVTISASDEEMKAALAQLIQSQVVGLNDVELVSDRPKWMVEMLGVTARNENKEPVLFVLSVLVTQHLRPKDDLVRKHAFYVTSGHDLQLMAKEVVERFDKEQLIADRKNTP
jgi:hypothetical protein